MNEDKYTVINEHVRIYHVVTTSICSIYHTCSICAYKLYNVCILYYAHAYGVHHSHMRCILCTCVIVPYTYVMVKIAGFLKEI